MSKEDYKKEEDKDDEEVIMRKRSFWVRTAG